MARLIAMLMVVAGCASGGPSALSVDIHYSADAPRGEKADTLSGARVGVVRFVDARPTRKGDLHSGSYLVHDSSYDIGVTWRGRTFAEAAVVVQALLVDELRHAGIQAEMIEGTVGATDLAGARVAGERERVDVVLVGTIKELSAGLTGKPVVALDATVIAVADGKKLSSSSFRDDSGQRDWEPTAQERLDDLMGRNFRQVAHRVVSEVSAQLVIMISAATAESGETPK